MFGDFLGLVHAAAGLLEQRGVAARVCFGERQLSQVTRLFGLPNVASFTTKFAAKPDEFRYV